MLIDLGAEVYAVGNRKKICYGPAKEYYLDLSEKEQLDLLLSQIPQRLDAAFICQGMAQTPDNALLVQKVNFLSVKYLAEMLAPRIVDRGSITIISSSGGFGWEKNFRICKEVIDCKTYEETISWYMMHPEAYEKSAYVFSKQCLNTYVKYEVFHPRYIGRKLRLNCICPGNTKTGLTDAFNRSASRTGDPEEGKRNIEKRHLDRWNGHWAAAEEMGWPLVTIGSQICSYMSGQIIYLDYGLSSALEIDEFISKREN